MDGAGYRAAGAAAPLRERGGDRLLEHVQAVGEQRLVDVDRRQQPHDVAVGAGGEHDARPSSARA